MKNNNRHQKNLNRCIHIYTHGEHNISNTRKFEGKTSKA